MAHQVFLESIKNNWPGLGAEISLICQQVGLPDINYNEVCKSEIKYAISLHHYESMMEEVMLSSKMENIKYDDFTRHRDYMSFVSLQRSRMAFRVRSQLVNKIPYNFKNNYRKHKKV